VLHLDEAVAGAVHDQRGHADRRQHVADVELADQVDQAPDRRRARGKPLEPPGPFHEAGLAALARRDA
jgi:hypothetical protein